MNRVYKKGIYCVSLHMMYFINLQISGFIQNNQKLQKLAFGWQSSNEAKKKFASFAVHPSQPVTWTVTQLISKSKVQLQKFTKILSYKKIICENVLTLTWGHTAWPKTFTGLFSDFRFQAHVDKCHVCRYKTSTTHYVLKKETWFLQRQWKSTN